MTFEIPESPSRKLPSPSVSWNTVPRISLAFASCGALDVCGVSGTPLVVVGEATTKFVPSPAASAGPESGEGLDTATEGEAA